MLRASQSSNETMPNGNVERKAQNIDVLLPKDITFR